MAYSVDQIVLAAEYALGTLDANERAQVETMMSVDQDFAGVVLAWEHRLGALNQMVGSVEPRPEVWEKIRAAIGHSEPQSPIVLPHLEPRSIAPEVERASVVERARVGAEASNLIQLEATARRWRIIAAATSAIAAALVVMIGIGVSMPDLLPDSMRPKAKTQVVEVKPPPAPQPSAQYVAVLQKEGGGPAFILTVDGATRNLTVRKLGASAEAGSSFELWLISDKLPKPRSLGVIGGNEFTSRPL
ncbi:MAG: anti-sigma factor, partial [Bradyrhizobium sp.]|nr:anti-sigma factor [Bradyrhizobium sp.]